MILLFVGYEVVLVCCFSWSASTKHQAFSDGALLLLRLIFFLCFEDEDGMEWLGRAFGGGGGWMKIRYQNMQKAKQTWIPIHSLCFFFFFWFSD